MQRRRVLAGGLVAAAIVLGVVSEGVVSAAPRGLGSTPTGASRPSIVNPDGSGSIPWQVALVRSARLPDLFQGQFCGGTIRDALHVITAAHCVEDAANDEPSEIQVVAGITDLNAPETTMQQRRVTVISADPQFGSTAGGAPVHDAAILTLDAPLDLTSQDLDFLAPVGVGATGTQGEISGWGSDDIAHPNVFPNTLLFAVINVLADSACSKYGADFDPTVMVCAGRIDANGVVTDACHGDSGGPLTRVTGFDATGIALSDALLGITSFGRGNGEAGCGDLTLPGIYTRVANPAINAFLTQPNPIQRPDTTSTPTVAGPTTAGSDVHCQPGTWTGSPTFTFQFLRVPVANGQPDLAHATPAGPQGPSDAYRLAAADVGNLIVCAVSGTNSGGALTVLSNGFGPITAAPPSAAPAPGPTVPAPTRPTPDVIRPTSHFGRLRCSRGRCIARLLASDDRGLEHVTLGVRLRPLACLRGRRGARCRRAASLPLGVRAAGSVGFDIRTSVLPVGNYRLQAIIIDGAGNRQARPATIVLRIRPLQPFARRGARVPHLQRVGTGHGIRRSS